MIKVSVIIPLYNAEKYLGVCLESILIQTLKDFEVIIVDDCSTDNSCAVAESYLEKFGGRMKIIRLEKNTGSGGIPRNVGLEFSCGKYIFFVDSDDFIIDTALEELFNAAEKFQAEAVYMEQGFTCGAEIIPQNLTEVFWNEPKFIAGIPKFDTENLAERINELTERAIGLTTWSKFSRRDFLVNNNLKFPNICPSQDVIWVIKWLCLAKKILRVPKPLYIYRESTDSVTNQKRSPKQATVFWLKPLIKGVQILEEFMGELEFFRQNPAVRLKLLNFFAMTQMHRMSEAFKALEPHEAYEIFLRELSKSENISPALTAYFCLMTNLYRNELRK